MSFVRFEPPPNGGIGFRTLAGPGDGLRDILLIGGRLPGGDRGPVHAHDGDELIRVVSGTVEVIVGDATRICTPGDVAIVPPGVPHGFRVLDDVVLEVVAGVEIGTRYPVGGPDGEAWVEVFRPDLPWGRPPPPGRGWTTDAELAEILAHQER